MNYSLREISSGVWHFTDISIILTILVFLAAIGLFASEKIRTDAIAIIVLLILAVAGIVTPSEAFSGFASEAVVAVISVMIISYGITKTGVMVRISKIILNFAGKEEKKVVATVSLFEGLISSVLQNIGAAALFLPALMRISKIAGIPSKKLLLPIGYAAITGGTITMIGSATLIIVNDYLVAGGYAPYSLFDVTPVGIALLIAGIAYFYFFGDYVLPKGKDPEGTEQKEIADSWHIVSTIFYLRVVGTSSLIGLTRGDARLTEEFNLHLIALSEKSEVLYAPWINTRFVDGQILAVLGKREDAERFSEKFGLPFVSGGILSESMSNDIVGFAEIIVRPRSSAIDKSIQEINFRKIYSIEPLILLSGPDEEHVEFSERPLKAGDTIVVHGRWSRIKTLSHGHDFLVATQIEGETYRETKVKTAVACFFLSIALNFAGLSIALSFLAGAFAMVVFGVISLDEAYRAVEWRIIVLIGGIMPLGYAMSNSGAAQLISENLIGIFDGQLVLMLFAAGIIMTVFSLSMSNIAATVVLIPLFISIAEASGNSPGPIALLGGICASNSFILPTHQVNALIKTPGGYRNSDYVKAGLGMTLVFLVISTVLVYVIFCQV
ncbi:di/tricarboxylate transporter [Methanomicrobium sp. W14]|uniref:SLC13 family permease n=1 Tax=Methanomicrobium sp. W14 TaxID=2817839 RepID=UPI001AE3A1A1|nr:SLC13 family permease [Methanomicrobium sp. W14]MBP2133852.1 di/tricarboxylate transporter [Methanomicrobium sp. W14]